MDLYPSSAKYHGFWTPGHETEDERGKVKVAWVKSDGTVEPGYCDVKFPITEAHWQQHLDGKRALVPCLSCDDGTAKAICLDVDIYGIDLSILTNRASHKAADFPLYVRPSKSAAHVVAFLDTPIPIEEARDRDQARYSQLTRIVTVVRSYLMQLPITVEFEDHRSGIRLPEVADSEAVEDAVSTCRDEIEELTQERSRVASSVLPIPDLYLAVDAHVQHLAARGRPNVTVHQDRLVVNHTEDGSFGGRGNARADALAVHAWLDPKAMTKALQDQIDQTREQEEKRGLMVLSVADRTAHLARIDTRILQLERMEEAFIEIAEGMNFMIERRDQASPLAILGIELIRRQRAVA